MTASLGKDRKRDENVYWNSSSWVVCEERIRGSRGTQEAFVNIVGEENLSEGRTQCREVVVDSKALEGLTHLAHGLQTC